MPNYDAIKNPMRRTHRPNVTGTRVTGAVNRLIRPCPDCKARRYEKCFQVRTIYTNPREYYRFYLNTIHEGRKAKEESCTPSGN